MEKAIKGIHHITALASDPQKNYDFYTGVLGLRMVKKTINFDAPDVYHRYYGDEKGTPGTIITFFPFPNAKRGKRGAGEITATAYSIPSGSLDYWMNRFAELAIDFNGPSKRFDEECITVLDPDGMLIELVTDKTLNEIEGWYNGDVPKEHSIRKFGGASFSFHNTEQTEKLISEIMGFQYVGDEGNKKRFLVGEGKDSAKIDLIENPGAEFARSGAGSVHHIAWRTANDEEQLNWRERIDAVGLYPTEVLDRNYFHSIYYREPGGILFEMATDPPGFAVDEDIENLGTELKLPEWYEEGRERIEKGLIPIVTKHNLKK